ncbi:MAG: hypothetical protein IJF42_05335 [Clostridia bacterium]|nr:hypothetical protein [Clostridia bacterium]MBQ7302972.1 hypothetical protein [Clostridia bacterium]
MKTALKIGLLLGVAAVGTAIVMKKYAPETWARTKEVLRVDDIKRAVKKVSPVEISVTVTPKVDDSDDLEEVAEMPAVQEVAVDEEWPDLSQIPTEE